jgi:hypothetical protein
VSTVVLQSVKSRLSELIQKPGGVTFEAAMAASEAALAVKAPPALELVKARVAELEQLSKGRALDAEGIEQAYGLASEIVNVTGCLKLPALFAVAYSLCEILDHFRTTPFSREAFVVHVQALRLILAGGDEGPAFDLMLDGLKAVKARVMSGTLEARRP